jgi:diguanylate cyclase (GGDEF)-like protein
MFVAAAVFLLVVAIAVLAIRNARGRRALDQEAERTRSKQQQIVGLSQTLKTAETELARKREIAEQIPLITRKLTEKLPQSAFPAVAIRSAKEFFHARQVGYFVPVEGSSELTLEIGVGFPPGWQGKVRVASNEGILGMAIQKKAVMAKTDPIFLSARGSSRQSLEKSGVEPDFVAPVFGTSGIAGVLVIAGCPFSLEEERKFVSMLVDIISTNLQNATLLNTGVSGVSLDLLTGVSNRIFFLQRFESEIRRTENYRQPLALLMFDIDKFKKINDTFGHSAGDVALKKLAEVVQKHTRSSDLVGRYGGDEFMVLMVPSASANKDSVLIYANHLREIIAKSEFMLPSNDTPVHLTISGGLAMCPADGQSTTDLLRAADNALYEAKRKGGNRILPAQNIALDGSIMDMGRAEQERTGTADGEEEGGDKEHESHLELVEDE